MKNYSQLDEKFAPRGRVASSIQPFIGIESVDHTILHLYPHLEHLSHEKQAHFSREMKKFIFGGQHHLPHFIESQSELVEYLHGLKELANHHHLTDTHDLHQFIESTVSHFQKRHHNASSH